MPRGSASAAVNKHNNVVEAVMAAAGEKVKRLNNTDSEEEPVEASTRASIASAGAPADAMEAMVEKAKLAAAKQEQEQQQQLRAQRYQMERERQERESRAMQAQAQQAQRQRAVEDKREEQQTSIEQRGYDEGIEISETPERQQSEHDGEEHVFNAKSTDSESERNVNTQPQTTSS